MFIRIEGGQAMSKEAVFTMKLEPELRDAFMAEALASHRPASQVMRELMRDFVQHQREAREYGDFLRAKVDQAREQVRAGNLAGGDEVEARYPIGSTIKGEIRNLTPYGAFVELEDGIDGMIHVSDLSWTRKINHPSEVVKKGEVVEACVLEIDKTNQRISLGVKQLESDPWSIIDGRFKVGDLVKGTVAKIASFGAFIQLEDDIDGLVHISQLSEEAVCAIRAASCHPPRQQLPQPGHRIK
jgi:ribosomal protein S1